MRRDPIKRGDISKLLDKVEDQSGARSSDYVLSIISGIANWYAKRHDDYTSPIIKVVTFRFHKSR